MPEHVVIRNHTPHVVVIVLPDGSTVAVPPRRPTPRLVVERTADGVARTDTADIPLTRTRVNNVVVDLPAPTPGTLLIVAQPIVAACPDRDDLVFPDEQVRDERQRVVGCRSLGRPQPNITPGDVTKIRN